MIAFDTGIAVDGAGLDLLAEGLGVVHIREVVFGPAQPLLVELDIAGNQICFIGQDRRHDGPGHGQGRHKAVFPSMIIPCLGQLGIEPAFADPVNECVSRNGRCKAEPHAPAVLKTQAIGILAVITDLVVLCAYDNGLFVIYLVLVHMLESPEAEVLGAIEPLDEEVLLFSLQAPHQLDTAAPALVAPFIGNMTVGFIMAVHA